MARNPDNKNFCRRTDYSPSEKSTDITRNAPQTGSGKPQPDRTDINGNVRGYRNSDYMNPRERG